MSAVIKFPKLAPDTTRRQGCSVVDNSRNGFILLYKSLKDVPFYRDPVRKSLWLHLLLEAAHERTVDTFNGNRITLSRGQLVGSARSLGEACGVSEDSARRSLDAFERDGMITRTSKQGTHGYTLVTLLNYDAYQRGVSEHNGAELGAEFKAAPDIGLQAPKDPSMARWANDVRLMRERDGRGHRDICELFRFVCQHGRELEFCQSPDKLRSQWDALQLKRSNAQNGVTSRTRPLSNLAAAQQASMAMQAQGRGLYDDDTPL